MRSIGRPSSQARLLALLTSTPGQEFHTRELVRRIGGTERPVHLALQRLENEGLLTSRRRGNLRLWTMDPKHPLYAPLRQIYARTVGIAAKLSDVLRAQAAVELAFIFGSYARVQDDASSDIDLFVLGEVDWQTFAEVIQRLSAELGREIKDVVYTEEDLRVRLATGSPFLDEMRRTEKIWLIGGDDEFERRLRDMGEAASGRGAAPTGTVGRGRPKAGSGGEERRPRAARTAARSGPRRRRG